MATVQPGKDMGLPLPDIGASANMATSKVKFEIPSTTWCPNSFAEAMGTRILQIVVFDVLGVALAALGERPGRSAASKLSHALLDHRYEEAGAIAVWPRCSHTLR